jgi:hypothetical protein
MKTKQHVIKKISIGSLVAGMLVLQSCGDNSTNPVPTPPTGVSSQVLQSSEVAVSSAPGVSSSVTIPGDVSSGELTSSAVSSGGGSSEMAVSSSVDSTDSLSQSSQIASSALPSSSSAQSGQGIQITETGTIATPLTNGSHTLNINIERTGQPDLATGSFQCQLPQACYMDQESNCVLKISAPVTGEFSKTSNQSLMDFPTKDATVTITVSGIPAAGENTTGEATPSGFSCAVY